MVEGAREQPGASYTSTLNLHHYALLTSQRKTLPPDAIILGIRFQHVNLVGGDANMQSVALTL